MTAGEEEFRAEHQARFRALRGDREQPLDADLAAERLRVELAATGAYRMVTILEAPSGTITVLNGGDEIAAQALWMLECAKSWLMLACQGR